MKANKKKFYGATLDGDNVTLKYGINNGALRYSLIDDKIDITHRKANVIQFQISSNANVYSPIVRGMSFIYRLLGARV